MVQVDGIDMINVLLAVDLELVISQGQTTVESLGAPDDQPVRVPRVGGFKVFVTCFHTDAHSSARLSPLSKEEKHAGSPELIASQRERHHG